MPLPEQKEPLFEIIHEDDELLVINKAAGLVCHPSKAGPYSSLIGRVRLHFAEAGNRAEVEALHLVNRLDRETSGVVLVAKRNETARELRRIWESREVEKEYLAIVHGHVRDDTGSIDAALGKDECSRVAVKDCVRADGLPSRTDFEVVSRLVKREYGERTQPANLSVVSGPSSVDQPSTAPFSVLRVWPRTGRKHQIRIHLAHMGHPIVGDKLYGGDEDLYLALVEDRLTEEQRQRLIFSNQALHAAAVRFVWRGKAVEFRCGPEFWFATWLEANGCKLKVEG